MQCSAEQFDKALSEGRLSIAFVGMSNIGKSYTVERLAAHYGYDMIEVDTLIREQLGQGSMDDFARWQGHPFTDGYSEREARSIALETKATAKALEALTAATGNQLLDTTGSVIYVDAPVLETLKTRCLIVHIAAEDRDIERLKADYFETPKPLVWRDFYKQQAGKTPEQSIALCYPALLASRQNAYEALADVTLPSSFILAPNTDAPAVMAAIRAKLP